MTEPRVREARADDHDAVAAFTAGTWSDQGVSDYLADAFPDWVADEAPDRRTVVATLADRPVGVCSARLLTEEEAWMQGIRVDPDHRGSGIGTAMTHDLFDWAIDHGATVARNMIFGWNDAALGAARVHGYEPVTTGRWARPDPDPDAAPALPVREDAGAAWAQWTDSDARTWLSGLALDGDEDWALAELRRSRLEALADAGRVMAIVDDTTRAMTVTAGVREGTDEDGETVTVADYAVAAWDDPAAAESLFDAIRADAAARDVDGTRVLIPETTGAVMDAASAGAPLSDEPFYVTAADLTDR